MYDLQFVGAGAGAGVLIISPIALTDATSRIVTNLGLDGYKPTDPEQANYIAAAKADPTGSSAATVTFLLLPMSYASPKLL